MTRARRWAAAFVVAALVGSTAAHGTVAAPFVLLPGDHICIIGNTLAERLQYDGWLDTMLYARYPRHDLVIRNLGFSGDEIVTRMRSKNFGTPDEWLSGKPAPIGGYDENRFEGTHNRADVIFAMFGYNESYAGESGLGAFKEQLGAWIDHTLSQKYNGRTAPRLVLFSPIAHEDLQNPDLPDGRDNNRRLELYTRAMAEVAQARKIRFVDLFALSQQAYAASNVPLTINGVHLNAEGNRRIAEAIDRDLSGVAAPARYPAAYLTRLREAVVDRNFHWFNRYRVTDGFNTFGDRAFLNFVKGNPRDVPANQMARVNKDDILPSNYAVLQRESAILDVMTENRDRRVFAAARGVALSAAALRANDADTPPPIDAGTNEPGKGPNGTHLFVDGDEAVSMMTMGPGLKANLFASEKQFPELVNPVQIAFDTRGRLWVAAWHSYPHWQPNTPMADKLLILEDTDGDGRADKRTVFAGDLNNPTGFEFWNGGVILAQQPNVVFLKDTNGDDKYDVKEILLHGLDSADTHHAINSFTFDPGGALYMQEGIFHRTQVETPWGPTTRQADGGVFRFEPRTFKFEVYIPMNFPNPHGHVFDEWGRDIVFDATGGQPYYGPSFSTKKYFPAMESTAAPKPGTVRVRPVGGTEILSSRHFPDSMQGNLLVLNNIGFQGVLSYRLTEDGAGLKSEEVDPILQSSDGSFRPVDAEIGPDGALYIADWQNPIVGHMQHNLRDTSRDHDHGRIYRITYPGRPLLTPAKIAGQPVPALLDLLKEPENRVRYRAKIELSGRPTADVMSALDAWMTRLDPKDPRYEHHMMEALWVRQWHNRVDEPLLKRLLRSPDPWARASATRVLCYWRDRVTSPLALLKVQVTDAHPAVRLEAVRAASFFQTNEAAEVALASLDRPGDRFIDYTLDQTMKTLRASTPVVLFNVSPAAVEYQLKRLSVDELARVERTPTDPRFRPVYLALLTRQGVPAAMREEALAALVGMLRTTGPAQVLLGGLVMVTDDLTAGWLIRRLLSEPPAQLATEREAISHEIDLGQTSGPLVRRGAYPALMLAGDAPAAVWQRAEATGGHLVDLLAGLAYLPAGAAGDLTRGALVAPIERVLDTTREAPLRAVAIDALGWLRPNAATFTRVSGEITGTADPLVSTAAIRVLARLPTSVWPAGPALEPLARAVVAVVEATPAARRTQPAATDAIHFGETLAAALPDPARVAVRRDLRALGVRVVRIGTIVEQMLFDVRWFAVEAGKPVQVVFTNIEAMPHNVVIGRPGSLAEIATLGAAVPLPTDPAAKAYVPATPLVLWSTHLLKEGETERLNFMAPAAPGEYVFLCTFPGHSTRMYGVMVVVPNLETFEARPTVPIDPLTRAPFTSERP